MGRVDREEISDRRVPVEMAWEAALSAPCQRPAVLPPAVLPHSSDNDRLTGPFFCPKLLNNWVPASSTSTYQGFQNTARGVCTTLI